MRRRPKIFILICIIVLLSFGTWLIKQREQFGRVKPCFVGSSTKLHKTVIVPTLDSPIQANRNVIWCASFLLAWRQAQNHVFHAPIQLAGANDVAQRLNNASTTDIQLDPQDIYTNTGYIGKGIIPTIRREMTAKYPDVSGACLPSPCDGRGVVTYAYLSTHMKFAKPYPQYPSGTTFIDGAQHKTNIRAFGISSAHKNRLDNLRKQVDVLFYKENGPVHNRTSNEFAIDVCRTSRPYRIILACIPPKATLAATVAEVQRRIATETNPANKGPMDPQDTLVIPEICWRITHHFSELEGQQVRNSGHNTMTTEALQVLDFTLDRSGVQLATAPSIVVQGVSKRLLVTRPFLLYLTRRGSNTPFFAMWIDNTELLNKQK